MANKVKGEVGFKVEDGDLAGEYVLLLDFNALCDLEDDFPGIMKGELALESPKAIRKVFAVGLSARHPDVNERKAGEIIQAVGLGRVAQLVGDAFKASFPEAAKGDADPR